MDKVLKLENGQYDLIETVSYPNGGASYFYVRDQQAIIIDDGICNYKKDEKPFSYSLITDKQNTYMNKYAKVYRFLKEDMGIINEVITLPCKKEEIPIKYVANREDHADASPLEIDFVIDVVDEYGAMAKPCSMHSIFSNPFYTAFGSILKRDYSVGDMIEVDGLHETVERIVQVDIETFEEKYGDYLNQEQLAREFYLSTGTITSWVIKGKISPDEMITFGSRKIYLFAPEHVKQIREENNIPEHTEETIKTDFFDFLEERDYSLSYKMPFLLSFLKNMNEIGDAKIDNVLTDYIAFYQDRIDKGLPVDRSSCPYNAERLKDRKYIKSNMLTNPFEKFERKRFLYYSKDLNVISMNHALFTKLNEIDLKKVKKQMEEDLEQYYSKIKIL